MNEDNQTNIEQLQNTVRDAAAQVPVQVDLVRGLQTEIFGFVGEHLRKINKVYSLRDKVQAQIEVGLTNNAYTPAELISFYKMLTQESAAGTDMIVSLFRPAPGVESFLAKNLSEDHTQKDKDNASAELLKITSPDVLQKIDQLARWISEGPAAAAQPSSGPTQTVPVVKAPIPLDWQDIDEDDLPVTEAPDA
jgi:hypothetical protein